MLKMKSEIFATESFDEHFYLINSSIGHFEENLLQMLGKLLLIVVSS